MGVASVDPQRGGRHGFGGTNNTDYKLYEVNGKYYITEYSHNYSTNIDLTELNQKLQAYVSSGG